MSGTCSGRGFGGTEERVSARQAVKNENSVKGKTGIVKQFPFFAQGEGKAGARAGAPFDAGKCGSMLPMKRDGASWLHTRCCCSTVKR